ncbi:MAG: 1,4-dihydroxy-2-naphthoate octaprenyltransferase [Bdellovibrionaceae bacterium]|nr:1,4-dihydroxy-2-naphthoate octaprenyltransferase [Pseudobdellovibrionaceae bacterium]
MRKIFYYFILGSRVKTWPVSLIPVAMSSALALSHGFFDKIIFYFSSFSILFIQISVNLFNDAFDGKKGLDDSSRKGPFRLVGSGYLTFSQVRLMAFISCFIAFLFGIPLIIKGGALILLIGLICLALTYFYTGSKYSILELGLSEIAVILFFGFFIVFGVYYLQTSRMNFSLIYLSLQCGLWALSALLINHLRDEKEDKKRARKHVVSVYGRIPALFLFVVCQAFIYLLCFYWMGMGLKSGAFSFLTLPFSLIMIYLVCNNLPSKKYNFYLAFCSFCYILFGFSWIAGLIF